MEQGVLILTITEPNLRGYSAAQELRRDLLAAVSQAQARKVVLDFQAVSSLSSEAFRPLLNLHRQLEDTGGRLVLCNLSPVVTQAFTATRLIGTTRSATSTFEVQPDLAAAVATLAALPGEP
jgi:anti-anti-sigma factor